jgi:hypothetical protein
MVRSDPPRDAANGGMSWKAPDVRNAEGLEIYVKVISPKSRADIRVDDVRRVDEVHIVRARDPSNHRQPKQG